MQFDDDHEDQRDECVISPEEFLEMARYYLRTFFRDKKDIYGSQIDPEELMTSRNVALVLNMDVCAWVPTIYKALKKSLPKKESSKRKGKVAEDVQLVLKLFREAAKLGLPKTAFTGLVAVYVETCLGFEVDVEEEDFEEE